MKIKIDDVEGAPELCLVDVDSFIMSKAVVQELLGLLKEGVIDPVEVIDRATPTTFVTPGDAP